jgi:hypothetical protein
MSRRRVFGLATVACAAMVLGLMIAPAGAQSCGNLSGAIFTTDSKGALVNGNIYSNENQVYLNGGPGPNAPSGAAGLPDGTYYYQVTDPPGAQLLSTEPIDKRIITVVNGVFTKLVKLAPFDETPNPGGVYKVWVTPVACYNYYGGFVSSASKTDNFKVWPNNQCAVITGVKFYDCDGDATRDPGEPVIPGWRILLSQYVDGFWVPVDGATTDASGVYRFQVYDAGTYRVEEILPSSNWIQTGPPLGYYVIDVLTVKGQTPVYSGQDFGNLCVRNGEGCYTIGFWHNQNGQALITSSDISILNGLNLFHPFGWAYPPFSANLATAKQQLGNQPSDSPPGYLLSADAKDMRWMLSAQLIAMRLNTLHGGPALSTIVYVNGFVGTVGEIIAQANAALLGANSSTQGYWKDILDALNNNDFKLVSPTPCLPIVYP